TFRFRGLDDIKESVAEAAVEYSKTVANISVRLCDPYNFAARAAAAGAVGVTLPWLLRKGILSRCKPSQALAMRTLQRLVKVCDKEALMPHLAELVATLIEGLSALEPQ
ncbi:unnamed protein product, partial [Ectocarpus sp. 8 AP-2014]